MNGVERPVSFPVKDLNEKRMEIVQSLAKWKRLKITELGLEPGFGIYTDMNALRPDEELDALHSIYVDQWDWEVAIDEKDRTVFYLHDIVKKVYRCIKRCEFFLYDRYPALKPVLPPEIKILFSEDLQEQYPNLTPKEREVKVTKQYGAVFITGIGGRLPDGTIHDGRAPDYDDWITETGDGHRGLNGDILVWHPVLNTALELSSMGIRVDEESLARQLKIAGCEERAQLPFQKAVLNRELPYTVGGGIGQSRICMFFLHKAHIAEVQSSIWDQDTQRKFKDARITLL